MTQINLLPDVKIDYIKAQQMKHTFIVVSIIVTIIAVSLLALLFAYVQIVQPRHKVNLQSDIDSGVAELKDKEDAVKIVTTQGVLEQIPGLEDKQLITSNLFKYLSSFTPKDVSYSEVKLDFTANTLTLTGQTTTLEKANVLANNLKSAKFSYTQKDATQKIDPFSSVVFASLGESEQAENGKNVGFQLSFEFDPILFDQKTKNGKITTSASSEELLLPTQKPFSENSKPALPGASQ